MVYLDICRHFIRCKLRYIVITLMYEDKVNVVYIGNHLFF